MTMFKQLCEVARTKPKAGEAFDDFARRLTLKINSVSDEEWKRLDEAAQKWHNEAMETFESRVIARAAAKKNGQTEDEAKEEAIEAHPLPELEGYETVTTTKKEHTTVAKGKKKEGAKQSSAAKRGRPPKDLDLGAKIEIKNEHPPFRAGTIRAEVFSKYQPGMTVAEARDAGVPFNHLRWHVDQGYVQLVP